MLEWEVLEDEVQWGQLSVEESTPPRARWHLYFILGTVLLLITLGLFFVQWQLSEPDGLLEQNLTAISSGLSVRSDASFSTSTHFITTTNIEE
ncbi:MAG: hypothetical protein ACPGWR_18605 [Ardenticatenaceae bacterium]